MPYVTISKSQYATNLELWVSHCSPNKQRVQKKLTKKIAEAAKSIAETVMLGKVYSMVRHLNDAKLEAAEEEFVSRFCRDSLPIGDALTIQFHTDFDDFKIKAMA